MNNNYKLLNDKWNNYWFENILKNLDKPCSWYDISSNPNISWEIIQNNPDKPWNWNCISYNPNITWDIIQNN